MGHEADESDERIGQHPGEESGRLDILELDLAMILHFI